MAEVTLDGRGRLPLPKKLRERYGNRYHIVDLHNGIKLIPLEDDPLDALREEFAGVEKTADDLRAEARDTALEEAER